MIEATADNHNDVAPFVSPDGRFLFFMRLSSRGSEVYWVDASVIDEMRDRIFPGD